jgi:hypothetical protein
MADNGNGNGELLAPAASWERRFTDTHRSWEAFEVYRTMGTQRSLVKVAQKLGKTPEVIERWSKQHDWLSRVTAWDRHQAQIINERVLSGTAEMRERLVNQALALQVRAQHRLLRMSDQEISQLSPYEICALMKTGADIETKARSIDPESAGYFAPDLLPPQFTIQVVGKLPPNTTYVQFVEDGRQQYGYVHLDHLDRFLIDFPDATVIR